MDECLALLVRNIARAQTERSLAATLMDHGPRLFGAVATGYYTMLDEARPSEIHLRGMPERSAQRYEREGRAIDPLFRWVWEHHASGVIAVAQLRSHSSAVGKLVDEQFAECGWPDINHYLLVPIVVAGALVGTMNFASTVREAPSLADAAALSAHVSARVAVLRAAESFDSAWDGALTAREIEIATLASRGLTTRDMARAVGITPNTVKKHMKSLYRKLGVASRAELSSTLLHGPQTSPPYVDHLPLRSRLGAAHAYFY